MAPQPPFVMKDVLHEEPWVGVFGTPGGAKTRTTPAKKAATPKQVSASIWLLAQIGWYQGVARVW